MAKVRPIKASEIERHKQADIPVAVFEVFNELIAKDFSNGSARVVQKDVLVLLNKKGLNSGDIFENHWLDVEGAYRAAGWRVEYDKPGYSEPYDAYFVFS